MLCRFEIGHIYDLCQTQAKLWQNITYFYKNNKNILTKGFLR